MSWSRRRDARRAGRVELTNTAVGFVAPAKDEGMSGGARG